jgi:hypothetical protein
MINYIALAIALALSVVSGYYSIVGLATIFASAFYPVVFMGCVLEAGKLITASWLYNNWSVAPRLLKYYLTSAVIILMFITSMGIFGFLSKAHIDQSVNLTTGVADQVKIISSKIDYQKEAIDDVDKQIKQIDNAISKLTERGQAQTSLKASDQQRKNRDVLVKKKEELVKNIAILTQERIKYESEYKRQEAEVGPLKYIAELVYDRADSNQLEKAVRFVIIILVCVFDPLAVVLLIAANVGILQRKQLTKQLSHSNIGDKILEIDDSVLSKNDRIKANKIVIKK